MVLISSGTFSGYQVTKPTLWHIIPRVVIAYLCNIVSMSHCLFTVTFSVYTAQKAASEPDLSCSEQAASRRSKNSKLPTGQLFVFLSVYVWEFRSMLWQPRSNGWRLQMWKGEQKPNRCFTLQFVATNWRACVSLSMCVQEYTVLYTGVLYQCVLIPAQLYRLLCYCMCVHFFLPCVFCICAENRRAHLISASSWAHGLWRNEVSALFYSRCGFNLLSPKNTHSHTQT